MLTVSKLTQTTLNHMLALIYDSRLPFGLSARSYPKVKKVAIDTINLKTAIEKGHNLIDVDRCVSENTRRCLQDHMVQKARVSRMNEALSHEIMRLISINQQIQLF